MWKATSAQHAEPAVYEVLGSISTNLSSEYQNYLLQLIYSIPFVEYTSRTINLIAQLQNNYSTYPSSTEVKVRKFAQENIPMCAKGCDLSLVAHHELALANRSR